MDEGESTAIAPLGSAPGKPTAWLPVANYPLRGAAKESGETVMCVGGGGCVCGGEDVVMVQDLCVCVSVSVSVCVCVCTYVHIHIPKPYIQVTCACMKNCACLTASGKWKCYCSDPATKSVGALYIYSYIYSIV